MAEDNRGLKTVRCRNPKNGVVYVYTYESFYDEAQKKYRQRRRCVGKVDPITGNVVDTLPRGAASRGTVPKHSAPSEKMDKNEAGITASLLLQIEELKAKNRGLETELKEARETIRNLQTSKDRLVKAIKAVAEGC